MANARPLVSALATSLVLVACGGAPPPEAKAPAPRAEAPKRPRHGMSMSSELGQLDAAKVDATFAALLPKLGACVADVGARNELASGRVKPFVRIAEDGSVRWAYLAESTLGDRRGEACMLRAISASRWPAPEGGEGQAQKPFDFDLSPDARPPVEWPAAKVAPALASARSRLAACTAGVEGRFHATLYVGTDGQVLGAGVAPPNDRGEAKADCVADVLASLTLESPGSWPAKVSFDVP